MAESGELFLACESGDCEQVRHLLQSNNIESRNNASKIFDSSLNILRIV
jgi:hypothetical protein